MHEKHVALEKHCGRWQLKLIYALTRIKSFLRYYSQRSYVHTDLHGNNCQNKSKQILVNLDQGVSRQALAFGTTVKKNQVKLASK